MPTVTRATSATPASRGAGTRLPRVAIVGRPNVGKSTLLNRMCGSRVSIVEPTAGVTRDRVAVPARLFHGKDARWVEVIDTGGIGIVDRDDLGPLVEEQVRVSLAAADVVLFLVDARDGMTPLDQEVARRLRGAQIPVVLIANKVEGQKLAYEVEDFRRMGLEDGPWPISAQNGEGLMDLYEHLIELLPDGDYAEEPDRAPAMKLAVVGRRNAGKSTLVNRLAREERMIVSEVPGTTRDAVDVRFERDGVPFVVIDTAGLRKKSSIADAIEFFSDARSHKSVRRADVVVLLFDALEPVSAIEKKLARYVVDHYKPVILACNKWDLTGEATRGEFLKYLEGELPGLATAPRAFLSAKEGTGVDELLELAQELHELAQRRVSTGELNRVLESALSARAPNSSAYRARVRYATQAEVAPPTFVLFVNDKKLFGKDYLRYLSNRLREELGFERIPVRIVLRDGQDGPQEDSPR